MLHRVLVHRRVTADGPLIDHIVHAAPVVDNRHPFRWPPRQRQAHETFCHIVHEQGGNLDVVLSAAANAGSSSPEQIVRRTSLAHKETSSSPIDGNVDAIATAHLAFKGNLQSRSGQELMNLDSPRISTLPACPESYTPKTRKRSHLELCRLLGVGLLGEA